MPTLRPIKADDIDALYAISLATGLAGDDATHLYQDGKLMGHIYSAPYACLEPGLALVLEDENGIAGFAVGTTDTAGWESRLEREWWPALRMQYPDPAGSSCDWTADQKRWALIHRPERTPAIVAREYPAHLHLNLLPRRQGQGLGARLFASWLELSCAHGVSALHVGVNRGNARALQFWARCGFQVLSVDAAVTRTVWMGRRSRGDASSG
jgi:GNAT superfamily N-acetyltransferase